MNGFLIVKVNSKYCDYLRKYDSKVPYNSGLKELRPFIGVLFYIDNMMYFAPLSSPKPKHQRLRAKPDLIKIDDGKLGVVNLNNMIPVKENLIELIDLDRTSDDISEKQYIKLLKNN
nr:type III toxin-antitoxin system ToxN/AbiQ family toxin [Bacilli bacterium]